MSRLCERPGCSEPGAAAYGMVPEDLLFWIAPLDAAIGPDPNVLCRRHADAMVVPRGWTLDDRREQHPRLFKPRQPEPTPPAATRRRRHRHDAGDGEAPEQLQIDGTGEILRPASLDDGDADIDHADRADGGRPEPGRVGGSPGDDDYQPWQPEFDTDDDLGGLLEVSSPLLARAFRGTDRRRS